ncbi:hypothetical protein CFO_g3281 [Ceratocystis platani]|uniref:ADF-H domain-containing protein n=1 Tax=Ceratocystis fimbriata f. sp. platani TaxID=88771 RepID=A0A0F8CUG5_CERFI|nr:hypothetical protein CFO_g3281 [Ceratocystis platani]
MSLNGLEDPAVLAAFETATGESGGWFLVKYASRDEVELHGSGNGGNTEIREAVANYADPSPLYGFLNYPRATVHFNMICDRFQPYDHLYEISEASQLQDSKLEVVCGFQPAEPTTPPVPASPSSPASPQRRRRLGEIAEEDDEDQEPNATRLKSKHIDDDAQELGSSDMAVASLPSPKDRITPEKARLMKAMKLREKKMNKAQGQDKPILSLADATDAVDVSNETDTNVSPMTADALENAVDDDDADTTTDGPSQLEDDESQPSMLNIDSDSSPTTTVNTDSEVSIESARAKTVTNDQVSELTLSESQPPSPVLDVSEITNSTKESSVSESTSDTDHSDDIKGNAIEDNVLSENQIEAVSKEVSVDNIEDEAIDEVPETPKAIGVIKEAASECVHVEATSEEATAVTEPSSTEEQEPIEKEAVTTKLEAQEPKTKEPEVVEQTETSKESVAIGEPKLAEEAKTSQEPKAEVHVIDYIDSSSIAVVSGSDSSISVEKNEDVEPTQETVPVPAKASEEVTKDATCAPVLMIKGFLGTFLDALEALLMENPRSPINMAPTVQEETIAAMGTAAVKARPKLKPTGDPEVTFMGDVNVQFPDNLLWKRRTMGLDNLGFLILTPVTASGTRPDKLGGAALKRFHLSDFKMPYVPDMELQELPNSVCLDFIEGSSLQIACGDRNGQVSILSALQAAHKTYST